MGNHLFELIALDVYPFIGPAGFKLTAGNSVAGDSQGHLFVTCVPLFAGHITKVSSGHSKAVKRPKQSLSNRETSTHTHTHSCTYTPPCADTHLHHLVPVHAQQPRRSVCRPGRYPEPALAPADWGALAWGLGKAGAESERRAAGGRCVSGQQ